MQLTVVQLFAVGKPTVALQQARNCGEPPVVPVLHFRESPIGGEPCVPTTAEDPHPRRMDMKPLPPSERLGVLVSNVTQTMLGISFVPVISDQAHPGLCWRTAVMLVDGARPLTVGLSSSQEGCLALTAAMFSCPASAVDPSMINDALRELVNMTAGLLKTEMALDQALTVPQVVTDASVLAKLAEMHPGLVLKAKELGLALWAHEGHAIAKLTAAASGKRNVNHRNRSFVMPRILTVDDSRAIRMIVAKQLQPLGFGIGEAEDGNDGLAKLQSAAYDLVVLDVTMPNLDGPGMLAKMREGGNKTPVLMLTSESKTAIVATVMRWASRTSCSSPSRVTN